MESSCDSVWENRVATEVEIHWRSRSPRSKGISPAQAAESISYSRLRGPGGDTLWRDNRVTFADG
jgi:hypothetical protein